VAVGDRTTLNDLFGALKSALAENGVVYDKEPVYRDFRPGDVRHSQADIVKAASKLGYAPEFRIFEGIAKAMPWYLENESGCNGGEPGCRCIKVFEDIRN